MLVLLIKLNQKIAPHAAKISQLTQTEKKKKSFVIGFILKRVLGQRVLASKNDRIRDFNSK